MVGSCSERAGLQKNGDGIVVFLALGVNDFVTETYYAACDKHVVPVYHHHLKVHSDVFCKVIVDNH